MKLSSIPEVVFATLSEYLAGSSFIAERATRSSFSGTPIFRINYDGRNYALRSWPDSLESRWKINCHRHAHRLFQTGLESRDVFSDAFSGTGLYIPVPELLSWNSHAHHLESRFNSVGQGKHGECEYLVRDANQLWTLSDWVPGVPIARRDLLLSETQKSSVESPLWEASIRFVAAFHRATSIVQQQTGLSPGIGERINVLVSIEKGIDLKTLCSLPISEGLLRELLQIIEWGLTNASRISSELFHLSRTPVHQHWIVRDFWRENLLLDRSSDRFYVVDFGASRCDTPVFDIVRLVGTIYTDRLEWARAWEIYRDARGIPLEIGWEHGLMLHRISTLGAILFWCRFFQSNAMQHHSTPRTVPRIDLPQLRLQDLVRNWTSSSG